MKLTRDLKKRIEEALDMRKKNGEEIWEDGDEISVNIAGTFVADKFITILNRTKNPYKGAIAHSNKQEKSSS